MATISLETWILATHTTHSAGIFIKDIKLEVVENDINKLSGEWFMVWLELTLALPSKLLQ